MHVAVIARTVVDFSAMQDAGYRLRDIGGEGTSADELAEFAGRACYQSWERPNPATATNAGYLENIIRQHHFSVLEHASATFYISDVSRSLTHELIRHRHLSFSQLSQRYVDAEHMSFVVPPAMDDAEDFAELADVFADAVETYRDIVEYLETERGLGRKQAREAARAVLPNMTSTSLVVTGNMRAWREVVEKRNSAAADAEIRQLAAELLAHLKVIAPHTFQDM